MPHSEFMVLICIVYKSLLGCVQGLQTQNAIIVEVVESIQLGFRPQFILSVHSLLAIQIYGICHRCIRFTRGTVRRPRVSGGTV